VTPEGPWAFNCKTDETTNAMAIILFSIYLLGVMFSKIRKKYDLAVLDFSL
jgi:hypothetical protein